LEDNWEIIRDEGLKEFNQATGLFKAEDEALTKKGNWKQLLLFRRGIYAL